MFGRMLSIVLRSVFLFTSIISLDVAAQPPQEAECKVICAERHCSSAICDNLYLGCDCDTQSEPRLEPNLTEHIWTWNLLLLPLFFGGATFLLCVHLGICVARCIKNRMSMARQPRVTIHHQDSQTAVGPPECQGDSLISSSCTGTCTSSDTQMFTEGSVCVDIEINEVDSNPITNSIPCVEALVSPPEEVIPSTIEAAVLSDSVFPSYEY